MTAEEMENFSKQYGETADQIENYIEQHPELSDEDARKLQKQMGQVLKNAERMATEALELAVRNTEVAVQELKQATQDAVKALRHIDDVAHAFRIVAAAVQVGGVLLDPSPGKVVAAIRNLTDAISPQGAAANGTSTA